MAHLVASPMVHVICGRAGQIFEACRHLGAMHPCGAGWPLKGVMHWAGFLACSTRMGVLDVQGLGWPRDVPGALALCVQRREG